MVLSKQLKLIYKKLSLALWNLKKHFYYDNSLHSHDVKYGSGSGQQSVTGSYGQNKKKQI